MSLHLDYLINYTPFYIIEFTLNANVPRFGANRYKYAGASDD